MPTPFLATHPWGAIWREGGRGRDVWMPEGQKAASETWLPTWRASKQEFKLMVVSHCNTPRVNAAAAHVLEHTGMPIPSLPSITGLMLLFCLVGRARGGQSYIPGECSWPMPQLPMRVCRPAVQYYARMNVPRLSSPLQLQVHRQGRAELVGPHTARLAAQCGDEGRTADGTAI